MKFPKFGEMFGWINKQSPALEKLEDKKASFVPPNYDDGAINIERAPSADGVFQTYSLDMDGTYRNDNEVILRYRSMSSFPEIDVAIEEIVNEAIVTDEIENPVKLILDKANELEWLRPETRDKINLEFEKVLELIQFRSRGYDLFKRWYVDARLYFHTIIDEKDTSKGILEIRYVDPLNIRKVREITKEKDQNGNELITGTKEFYLYSRDSIDNSNPLIRASPQMKAFKLSPDIITYVNSGLYDPTKKLIYGHLHKAIRTMNQVKMLEDSMVIYRLARAPERRVFNVDVGNLPRPKAEQYLKELITKYRSKLQYDAATGEVRDDRRYMSVLEDFWMPKSAGSNGTTISTLPGASNLNQIDDVQYFLNKLYKSLNIPFSRLQSEQKSFQIGRSTEISRDEIKFAKFIERLRTKFADLFYDLLRKQLILKGIVTDEYWEELKPKIRFHFLQDMYFSELKELEVENERLSTITNMEPYIGKYYSRAYVLKNVLRRDDQEVKQMQEEIEDENKQDIINKVEIDKFDNDEKVKQGLAQPNQQQDEFGGEAPDNEYGQKYDPRQYDKEDKLKDKELPDIKKFPKL